jgi:hypothetical protein
MVRFDLVIDAIRYPGEFWKALDAIRNLDEFLDRLVIFCDGRDKKLLAECRRRASSSSTNEKGQNIVLLGRQAGSAASAWEDYIRLIGEHVLDVPRYSLFWDPQLPASAVLDIDSLYESHVAKKNDGLIRSGYPSANSSMRGSNVIKLHSQSREKSVPLLLLFDSRWGGSENFQSGSDGPLLKNVQVIPKPPLIFLVKGKLKRIWRKVKHPFQRTGVLVE